LLLIRFYPAVPIKKLSAQTCRLTSLGYACLQMEKMIETKRVYADVEDASETPL